MKHPLTRLIPLGLLMAGTSIVSAGKMYAVDSSRAFYELDITNGTRIFLGSVSANAGTTAGLAYDESTGTIFLTSTSTDSLYTLDLSNLAATLVGPYGDSTVVMHGLEIGPNGNLYAASGGGGNFNFYQVDKATGVGTLLGPMSVLSFTNLGFNSTTGVMYATNSGTDCLYTVDLPTGTLTLVGLLNGPTNPNGLAYNRDNNQMYLICNNTDTLYTVDLATGQTSVVGLPGAGNYLGLVYVPENTYRVTGTINLGDTVPGPLYSRQISVKLTQGATVVTANANVAGTGSYTLEVPDGTVGAATIEFDGSSFLKRVINVNLTGSGQTENATLVNGDANNSGEVDAVDIDLVIADFGSVAGADTDVDMSSEVDAVDIDIVIANFGSVND